MFRHLTPTAQSAQRLQAIPRARFSGLNMKAVKLFKVKAWEMKIAKAMAKRMAPKTTVRVLTRAGVAGTTALGFKIDTAVSAVA